MLLAFQDLVYVADHPYFINDELGFEGFPFALVPHSTEWLDGVIGLRRMDPFLEELYFTPGCRAAEDYLRSIKPPLPTCSIWYRLLVGELRLREEIDSAGAFTVRTLEQCLLALSGSVTLLLIR